MLNKAIFLDRDGVINKLIPDVYVNHWDQFEFIPEAVEGLKLLVNTEYSLFIVSNQGGIGRGYAKQGDVDFIFYKVLEFIHQICDTGDIDYMYCPHVPDEGCACRKPSPGMLYALAVENDIDLSQSWMIGDSDSDMEAAARARIDKRIKIHPHYTSDDVAVSNIYLANNLLQAVEYIIATAKT